LKLLNTPQNVVWIGVDSSDGAIAEFADIRSHDSTALEWDGPTENSIMVLVQGQWIGIRWKDDGTKTTIQRHQ